MKVNPVARLPGRPGQGEVVRNAHTGISNGRHRCTLINRQGFTLLEMMLVLGVIAVFASMTLPSVMRMFKDQKLVESAERVRAAAASARFRAIESGVTYQFCCESNGTHFIVVPFEADHIHSNSGNQSGPVTVLSRGSGRLPKGIAFNSFVLGVSSVAGVTSGVVTTPTSQRVAITALDGLPNSGDLAGLNWSTPVLFHPDGSASTNAEIKVADSRSQHIKLRIRALTGAVSMDRIHSENRK